MWWVYSLRLLNPKCCARVAPAAPFLGERLLALPGVKETRTYAVMEEVKRDAPLPVG